MEEEKKVIEPEIVNESKSNDKFDSFEDISGFAKEFAEGELKGIKNKVLIQGFLYLFIVGVVFILILWGIAALLSIILPPIFVIFIISAIVLAIGYPIYWVVKKFRG